MLWQGPDKSLEPTPSWKGQAKYIHYTNKYWIWIRPYRCQSAQQKSSIITLTDCELPRSTLKALDRSCQVIIHQSQCSKSKDAVPTQQHSVPLWRSDESIDCNIRQHTHRFMDCSIWQLSIYPRRKIPAFIPHGIKASLCVCVCVCVCVCSSLPKPLGTPVAIRWIDWF